jgi:ribosomal protein S18 acetylase RimI-like enzyme
MFDLVQGARAQAWATRRRGFPRPAAAPYNAGMIQIVPLALQQPAHEAALLSLLDHYARDPMGGGAPLSATAMARLPAALRARSDYVGFLALAGSTPVGLINCFEGFSTFAARPLLNVHDIVVHRDWRGQGISHRLLAAAETLARERDCCKLTLEVLSGNTVAQAAYRRFGFVGYALDPAAGQAVFLQKCF